MSSPTWCCARPSTPADLTREKQVVAQEIAEAADAPDDYVFDLIQRAAWGDHPVGRPILGSDATVEAATVEALSDWRAASTPPTAWWSAPPARSTRPS
jgi:predicted Zn-dependent peptidase